MPIPTDASMGGDLVLAAAAGAATWSLLEYVIHRFAGHARTNNLFGREHVQHHAKGDYFAPAWKKGLAAVATTALAIGPATVALGGEAGLAYVLGLVGFYLTYEVLHRLEHTWAGVGPYARWARRHHFHHHFVDPRVNHGVTSPLWDVVFGTYRRPGRIAVPEKLAMRWLVDPATGDIRQELQADYALRRRKAAQA